MSERPEGEFQGTWLIAWGSDEDAQVATLQAADELLDRLHASCRDAAPIFVDVRSPDSGDILSIALGHDLSTLSHTPGSRLPPYLCSVGGRTREPSRWFFYMGSASEIPGRRLIPVAEARTAVRHFMTTGGLSEQIGWEEA